MLSSFGSSSLPSDTREDEEQLWLIELHKYFLGRASDSDDHDDWRPALMLIVQKVTPTFNGSAPEWTHLTGE